MVSIAVFFSSSFFEGVGFLLTTGPWFWPLLLSVCPLSVILFLLPSEISSVVTNATGRSYVACSVVAPWCSG